MILELDDWKFDIDLTGTMEYTAKEAAEHCTCAYCRNFYNAVDDIYPDFRPFMAQFGVNIEAPDELMPYDVGHEMWYDGFYAVCGRILSVGASEFICNGVKITPNKSNQIGMVAQCPEPYFCLNFDSVVLPWKLNEPMEDVISPANEPSFLQKMWNRLLSRQPKDDFPT